MIIEEDPPTGLPEWVVTYGDMMSLLLTFFILLVSLSEIKKNDRFQGITDSIQQHFGYESPHSRVAPGGSRPRNSELAALALSGRSQRKALLKAGVKDLSATQDEPRVRVIRPGERTNIGTVISFADGETELSAQNRDDLYSIAGLLRGKPQKIEVRGHTSRRPPPQLAAVRDNWDLAYERCRETLQYLVEDLQIDPARVRMSVAGPYEPVHLAASSQELNENARVEIFLLEEVTEGLAGIDAKRK